jgi:S1-C subfamily serine protease
MPTRFLSLAIVPVLLAELAFAQDREAMRERYRRIKESTVKVLVDDERAGSGFAVGDNLVATNFHVVQRVTRVPDDQIAIDFAPKIEIELQDGRKLAATPHPSFIEKNLGESLSKDVVLLTISEKVLRPLKVGTFADASEGDTVCVAGYPFGVEQVIITRGALSTKWKAPGNMNQGGQRDAAWLDVSMTRGNSGGPVVVVTDDPDNDVVIGIATAILSPFAQSADDLARVAAATPGNVILMGVDFKKFLVLVGSAIASQSHGVGGCVAIDYLKLPKE